MRLDKKLLFTVHRSSFTVLKFDHFEIGLVRSAIGTAPAVRHIGPARARRYAFLGQTALLVVGKSAQHALPFLEPGGNGRFALCRTRPNSGKVEYQGVQPVRTGVNTEGIFIGLDEDHRQRFALATLVQQAALDHDHVLAVAARWNGSKRGSAGRHAERVAEQTLLILQLRNFLRADAGTA